MDLKALQGQSEAGLNEDSTLLSQIMQHQRLENPRTYVDWIVDQVESCQVLTEKRAVLSCGAGDVESRPIGLKLKLDTIHILKHTSEKFYF